MLPAEADLAEAGGMKRPDVETRLAAEAELGREARGCRRWRVEDPPAWCLFV
jgi:hypothetical protein